MNAQTQKNQNQNVTENKSPLSLSVPGVDVEMVDTEMVDAEKSKPKNKTLPEKFKKLLVFEYWLQLSDSSSDMSTVIGRASLSIQDQISFFTEYENDYKEHVKNYKKFIKESKKTEKP
jgi:hypothetical protein